MSIDLHTVNSSDVNRVVDRISDLMIEIDAERADAVAAMMTLVIIQVLGEEPDPIKVGECITAITTWIPTFFGLEKEKVE